MEISHWRVALAAPVGRASKTKLSPRLALQNHGRQFVGEFKERIRPARPPMISKLTHAKDSARRFWFDSQKNVASAWPITNTLLGMVRDG